MIPDSIKKLISGELISTLRRPGDLGEVTFETVNLFRGRANFKKKREREREASV